MTLSTALLGLAALGYVGSIDLDELVDGSDRIALGRVVEVREVRCDPPLGDFPFTTTLVADLEVERALLGTGPGELLSFHAASTWMCDLSSAEQGERVLLFLGSMDPESARSVDHPGPLHRIEHSGRGRLPVKGRPGAEWVANRGVHLPAGLAGARPSLEALLGHVERRVAGRPDAVAPDEQRTTEHGALPAGAGRGSPFSRTALMALGALALGAALMLLRARESHAERERS
jgi:hypothetical protein